MAATGTQINDIEDSLSTGILIIKAISVSGTDIAAILQLIILCPLSSLKLCTLFNYNPNSLLTIHSMHPTLNHPSTTATLEYDYIAKTTGKQLMST